jgi:hypothetical protein
VTYDLEGVGNDADGHELLSVVTAVHHQRVGETLDDGALCLSESLLCVSAGGMGDVDWGPDLDVIAAERIVSHDLANLPIPNFSICILPKASQFLLQIGFLTSMRCRGFQRPHSSIC